MRGVNVRLRSGAQRAGRRPRQRPRTRRSLVLESDIAESGVKGKGGKEIYAASRPSPRMLSDLRGGVQEQQKR